MDTLEGVGTVPGEGNNLPGWTGGEERPPLKISKIFQSHGLQMMARVAKV